MNSKQHQQCVLVTGSEGQLGSELRRVLGARAVGLDLPEFDMTDRGVVRGVFERYRPDVVVNAAAFTHVDGAEKEPERCYAVNVRGVENLVDASRESGTSIVQISTDYVFDGRQTKPYCESDQPNPLSTYGRSKWEAEQIVAQHPRHLILRTAGLFGVGGANATRNFVDTMLRLAAQGRPLRVVGDQMTSLTDARDLALAITTLAENREHRPLSRYQLRLRQLVSVRGRGFSDRRCFARNRSHPHGRLSQRSQTPTIQCPRDQEVRGNTRLLSHAQMAGCPLRLYGSAAGIKLLLGDCQACFRGSWS